MRSWTVLAMGLVVIALTGRASASIVTFESAPLGFGFTGPVTEDGFTYETLSGNLFVEDFGNPGQDMEGDVFLGGGALDIVSAVGGETFTFDNLDFSASVGSDYTGSASQTLTVEGLLGGSLVAIDAFVLSNSVNSMNWTTEAAANLAGVTVDELQITLSAGDTAPGDLLSAFKEAVDNIVFTPTTTAVPEPSSSALFATGMFVLGLLRRRKHS